MQLYMRGQLKTGGRVHSFPTSLLQNADSSAEVAEVSVANSPGLSSLAVTWEKCLNNFISFLWAHTIFFALPPWIETLCSPASSPVTAGQAGDGVECNVPFRGSSEQGLTWNRSPHHSFSVGPPTKPATIQHKRPPLMNLSYLYRLFLASSPYSPSSKQVYRGKGRICRAVRCSCCTSGLFWKKNIPLGSELTL